MNKKLEKLYEGKAKILYQTENYEQLIQYFMMMLPPLIMLKRM